MMEDPIGTTIKLLVTHQNPDMDAIGAIWLWKRFAGRDFDGAEYYFVHAGDRVEDDVLSARGISENEVVHVDTGMGKFDHHQPNNTTHDSATLRVYQYLTEKFEDLREDEALKRVVGFINETDHFAAFHWPEADKDRYLFMMEEILAGLRSKEHFNDRELVEFGMLCYDGAYTAMKVRVSAEEDLERLAFEFDSPWGKALAIENNNDEVMKLAQKRGYVCVVRKSAEEGNVRIKLAPLQGLSLKAVYEEIKRRDQDGNWYYHPSGHMLLNGSKKAYQKATKLSLKEVVEIIKEARS